MRKLSISIFIFCFLCSPLIAQNRDFEGAYYVLNEMLEDSTKYSFKKGVFAVEDAYLYGQIDTTYINYEIKKLTSLTEQLLKSRKLKDYPFADKERFKKYAALYTVMTDTIPLIIGENKEDYVYVPYRYDFEDIWGHTEWSNMFVSKLLLSGKGNCHSLPYLYKILAEEIGVEAHLALAPNHVYIKHQNLKDGWYNTELTSGFFPIDAWIMASGYVHLDGIRNGLYMKALNNEESIALLLVDLAQGYEKRNPINDGSFVLKCTQTALKYYPNYINALLLKLETTKKQLQYYAEGKGKQIDEITDDPKGKLGWIDLNNQVRQIHELGYRQMPKEMYLDWLVSLKEEQEKYTNKEINTFNKSK